MYFYPLNFIRFVLAVGVILFHYGLSYYPFNEGILKTLIVNSSFRVSFFFFISGFVMCMVYAGRQESGAGYFYRRRLSRIFPLYWLAFICTLLLVLFVNHASPKGLVIILHFLGLQSLYPGYVLDLNYPAWSVSVELVFYLFFPLLLKGLLSLPLKKLLMLSCVTWLIQTLQHIYFVEFVYNGTKASEEFISSFPVWHLPTFFAGMAAARLIALQREETVFTKHAGWFFWASVITLLCLVLIPNPVLKYAHNGLLNPVFAVLILALYYDRSLVHRVLSNRYVSSLGNLSYGLFIFQYPVWLICTKLSGPGFVTSGWFFLVYLLCLLAVARLIHAGFEKPVLKWLRNGWPSRQRSADLPAFPVEPSAKYGDQQGENNTAESIPDVL